jgi:hypothetical protein
MLDQQWFEMDDIRRRSLERFVWIPLRSIQILDKAGKHGCIGYREEFYGVGTLAVHDDARSEVNNLGGMEVGTNHEQHSYFDGEEYVPADTYRRHDGTVIGLYLVLDQHITGEDIPEWHLHQDLVFSLNLKREGDEWICPVFDYAVVARLRRDEENKPILLEMKAEYLRDYLCGRKLALYASTYRSRVEIVANSTHISWNEGRQRDETEADLWEGAVVAIHEGGMPFGDEIAVFHAGRTDVDPDEDVPSFDFPTDDQVSSESWTTKAQGQKLFRIQGELWKNEWLEPGDHSYIVREDKRPSTVYFITDQSGKKETQDTLVKGSRWLWFKPDVMMTLAHRRGGGLGWYTRDTGAVQCSPSGSVHFGVNKLGLVNVYAKDIGMLPEWQQRIWSGFNITPEGGVSEELLASQMRADPARTQAPEAFLKRELNLLDRIAIEKLGGKLFREHEELPQVLQKCHRFRAIDDSGLYALAKDLTKAVIDRIDVKLLHTGVLPPRDETWGSIKSLEKVLAGLIGGSKARSLLSPLVGIYELRLADAHPKGSEIQEALQLAQVDTTLPLVHQGRQMMYACVAVVHTVATILRTSSR